MAQSAGAAVDVDLFRRQFQLIDGGQGDHCEGFVDFEQVDVIQTPAGFFDHLFNGTDGARVELAGKRAWVAWATIRACGVRPRF